MDNNVQTITRQYSKVKSIRLLLLTAILYTSLSAAVFNIIQAASNIFVDIKLYDIPIPDYSSRLLVVAPHCDDEVLAASELIRKTVENGGKAKVIVITNGDGARFIYKGPYFGAKPEDYIALGYERQRESIMALKILGLLEEDIIFLGYPDAGLYHLWNSNWDSDIPYTSRYTKVNKSPYLNSYTRDAPYTGEGLEKDLATIMGEYKPTHVVFPHFADEHPDHSYTSLFVDYALSLSQYSPEYKFLYLIHYNKWPVVLQKHFDMYLTPPAALVDKDSKWYKLDLDKQGLDRKSNAVNLFSSQLPGLSRVMKSFVGKNELFCHYD